MIEPIYVVANTPLHRIPAGLKLIVLAGAGAGLFVLSNPAWLIGLLGVAGVLVWSTGVSSRALWRQLRGVGWVLGAIALFATYFHGWLSAVIVLARMATLIALGLVVTLSSRGADLFAAAERGLRPLERLGFINAGQTTLAFALALRFVPEIWRTFEEIRQAQAARGLAKHPLALSVPLVVRTLKRADEIAEAIDARS
jgi:biotin transport system permease protein